MTNLQHTKPNIDQYLIAGERPSLNEQEKERIKAEIQKYLNLLKDNAAVTGNYTWRFPSTNSQTTLTPDEKNEQIAQDNLANLANKDYLIKGLASRIDPELTSQIEELLYEITLQRKLQGESPYTEKAIEMLVIEILYGDFLWRTHRRKAQASPLYFRTHLMAAALNHAKSGFTSLPRILAALKHDDYEDLLIHKQFENNKLAAKPNPKLLFADLLYIDQTSTPNDTIQTTLAQIQTQVALTVEGLTTIADSELSSDEKDKQKNLTYIQNSIKATNIAVTKVLEQIQNAETLDGLGQDRQKEKAKSMLLLHVTMAKILELDLAIDALIVPLLTILNAEALQNFKIEQTQCLQRITPELRRTLSEFATEHPEIINIAIKPKPIANYLKLNQQNIKLDQQIIELGIIPKHDLLHEIIITTQSNLTDYQLLELNNSLLTKICATQSIFNLQENNNDGRGQSGVKLKTKIPNITGQIEFTINTEQALARGHRGVLATKTKEQSGIPKWLTYRITKLLNELKLLPDASKDQILALLTTTVLAPTISVFSDAENLQEFKIMSGSTVLDFIFTLPGSDNLTKFLNATNLTVYEFNPTDHKYTAVNFWDQLKPNHHYKIQVTEQKNTQQQTIRIGHLFTCGTHPLTQSRYAEQKPDIKYNAAEAHIKELEIIFNFNDLNAKSITHYQKIFKQNQKINKDQFMQIISNLTFDPLSTIAESISTQKPTTLNLTFNLQDQPGALEKITTYLSQNKINIKGINTSKQTDAKTTVHLEIDPSQTKPTLYHLLKKLLTINYMPGVDEFRIEGRD
jgi:ACT domain-containing protein